MLDFPLRGLYELTVTIISRVLSIVYYRVTTRLKKNWKSRELPVNVMETYWSYENCIGYPFALHRSSLRLWLAISRRKECIHATESEIRSLCNCNSILGAICSRVALLPK